MKGAIALIVGLGIISFLPILRGAGHSRHDGVNFWRWSRDSTRLLDNNPFGHPHILYNEAVIRAREAYQEMTLG